jgi:glycosyltransferase involved in cell wall biosynthesis
VSVDIEAVLIGAYACEPDKGSEPEAGFQWVCAAAATVRQVLVLTRANNKAAIEASSLVPANVEFAYFDLSRPWLSAKRWLPYGTQLYYLAWQVGARHLVRKLHARQSFDLTHHLTFAVDWLPSAVRISSVPFIWGPVGGATGLPWKLWRSQGLKGFARELGRELTSRAGRRVFGRSLARSASMVVAQNRDEMRLWKAFSRRILLEPNVTVDDSRGAGTAPPTSLTNSSLRRAVFAGRLIPHKGLAFAIESLAQPAGSGWSLHVLGDGSERVKCRQLAEKLGIGDRVFFEGRVPHEQVAAALRVADAFVAPSMYEGSGFSVAEAVTFGCPVVATDRGGPAVMVPPDCGVLVPADGQLAHHIAEALSTIGPRRTPTNRWNVARLPRVVADMYAAVRA